MDNGSLDRALLPPDCLSRPPGVQLGGVDEAEGIEPPNPPHPASRLRRAARQLHPVPRPRDGETLRAPRGQAFLSTPTARCLLEPGAPRGARRGGGNRTHARGLPPEASDEPSPAYRALVHLGDGLRSAPPFAAPGHPPKEMARCLQGQQQPGGTHAPQEAGGSRTFQAGRSATGEASPADDPATLRPQRNGCCCGPPEYRARQAPVLSIEWR